MAKLDQRAQQLWIMKILNLAKSVWQRLSNHLVFCYYYTIELTPTDEQISQLPRAKQKFIMEMPDTVIQQAS